MAPAVAEPRTSLPLVEPVPVPLAMTALTVKVVPASGRRTPVELTSRAMPRLAARVTSAVVCSAPPAKASWPAVAVAGTAPRAESLEMTSLPPVMVVLPAKVEPFAKVSVPGVAPVPALMSEPVPVSGAPKVTSRPVVSIVEAALIVRLLTVMAVVAPKLNLRPPPLRTTPPVGMAEAESRRRKPPLTSMPVVALALPVRASVPSWMMVLPV